MPRTTRATPTSTRYDTRKFTPLQPHAGASLCGGEQVNSDARRRSHAAATLPCRCALTARSRGAAIIIGTEYSWLAPLAFGWAAPLFFFCLNLVMFSKSLPSALLLLAAFYL